MILRLALGSLLARALTVAMTVLAIALSVMHFLIMLFRLCVLFAITTPSLWIHACRLTAWILIFEPFFERQRNFIGLAVGGVASLREPHSLPVLSGTIPQDIGRGVDHQG